MVIDSMTENSLMAELMIQYQLENGVIRQPGDVTAIEFAAALNISDTAAREFLNSRVKAGELESFKELGTKNKLYRKIKKPVD